VSTTNTPYENLTPDLILDAVESLDLRCTGSLTALNSYENRVYQVGIEDEAPLVAKFYRPLRWTDEAIIEEHQFGQELMALEIPVIAPLEIKGRTLHEHAGFRFALFPRKGGRALEVDNMEQLEQMGRFIGRIHAVGECRPFQHRIRLDAETYGEQPYQFLLANHFISPEILHNFSSTATTAIQLIRDQFTAASDIPYIRLHGDCHAGNILWNGSTMHIVDLDDCLMGPAVQDIWMMLSGSAQDTKLQLKHILDGYYEFHDFNPRELHLTEALRTLRMIHYAGWLAKRWQDPAFPANFPWFNTSRYWETLLNNLREQVDILHSQE
jgi:Ser/Thr protein kinase RdoA (MazF antagonist)